MIREDDQPLTQRECCANFSAPNTVMSETPVEKTRRELAEGGGFVKEYITIY